MVISDAKMGENQRKQINSQIDTLLQSQRIKGDGNILTITAEEYDKYMGLRDDGLQSYREAKKGRREHFN